MSKKIFFVSTALFWSLIAFTTAGVLWLSPADVAIADSKAPQDAGKETSKARMISAAELAKHRTPKDCWMAIRGTVYDLTAYLPTHPTKPEVINPWCGKEATFAYDTKMAGRPHGKYTDQMLDMYKIGSIEKKQ